MFDIKLRPATVVDAPAIHALIADLAADEGLADRHEGTEDRLLRTVFGSDPFAHVVVAESDDCAIVGFTLYYFTFCSRSYRPVLYMGDLFVVESMRGKGLGRRMMAHLANIALEARCGRMEWEAVNWNNGAIRLYERMGAVRILGGKTARVEGEVGIRNLMAL